MPAPAGVTILARAVGSRRTGMALSLVAAVLGASCLVAYKAAGQGAAPAVVVLAAMLWAAALNTVVVGGGRILARAARGERAGAAASPGLPTWGELALGALLAACTLAANLAVLRSLASLNPALTSVLSKTQVLIVAALAWPLLGERVTARFALGAVLAVAGFAVMHASDRGGLRIDAGSLWALAAATAWALMQVAPRKVIHRVRLGQVNGVRLWLSAAGLALVPGNAQALAGLEARVWLMAGLAALAGPFLSRLALLHSLRHIPASHSTLLTLSGPVFAAALALAAFGIVPAPVELAGAGLVLLGIALPVREMTRPEAREPEEAP